MSDGPKRSGTGTGLATVPENEIRPRKVAVSSRGMVASQHWEASEAGAEILADGGNAVDAAVATAFALGVVEPAASGLGGQTAMLLHTVDPRRTFALDGSSRAPSRAVIDHYRGNRDRFAGHRATTVPSTPAVLAYTLSRYGTLPLRRILEPSIRLARDGYVSTELQRQLQEKKLDMLRAGNAASIFLEDGAHPRTPGTIVRQPTLAATLERIAEKGVEDFYQGEIAALIEADMRVNDGFIQRDDLANIPNPIERRPVSTRFRNARVLTYGPPGAGRTLVEMLNILSHFEPKEYDTDTRRGALLVAETIRRAQLDRRDRPYEPNFYQQVDERQMTDRDYARRVARQIDRRARRQKGETTHLSVMDAQGNAVALTQSIERVYGAGVVAEGLGFLYNNYMSAFEHKDITHPYYLRPNGIPWASVAPTIVFRGKLPHLVIGSPGSERITAMILHVMLRLSRQSLLDAITAPRFHCFHDGRVWMEGPRIRNDIIEALERRGFAVENLGPFAFHLGCVQAIKRERAGLVGAADPRRDGSAAGPPTADAETDSPG